jgi:hypothetical protein
MDHEDRAMGFLVGVRPATGTACALNYGVQSTFLQKVFLCMIAAFFAAGFVEWAKMFIEGADDALNKGYKHRAAIELTGKP